MWNWLEGSHLERKDDHAVPNMAAISRMQLTEKLTSELTCAGNIKKTPEFKELV